jgi:hypothetical protein
MFKAEIAADLGFEITRVGTGGTEIGVLFLERVRAARMRSSLEVKCE